MNGLDGGFDELSLDAGTRNVRSCPKNILGVNALSATHQLLQYQYRLRLNIQS